jgi:hypothetical protein
MITEVTQRMIDIGADAAQTHDNILACSIVTGQPILDSERARLLAIARYAPNHFTRTAGLRAMIVTIAAH